MVVVSLNDDEWGYRTRHKSLVGVRGTLWSLLVFDLDSPRVKTLILPRSHKEIRDTTSVSVQ